MRSANGQERNFISIMKHCVCAGEKIIANNCIWLQIPLNHHTLAAHSIMVCSAVGSILVSSRAEARSQKWLKGSTAEDKGSSNHSMERRDTPDKVWGRTTTQIFTKYLLGTGHQQTGEFGRSLSTLQEFPLEWKHMKQTLWPRTPVAPTSKNILF